MSDTLTADQVIEDAAVLYFGTIARTVEEMERRHGGVIREAASIGKDHLAISGASSVLRNGRDHERDSTIEFAARELERIVELNAAGISNPSQREFAESVRENRHIHARRILTNILSDPEIQNYWAERKHYGRSPNLTATDRRDLERLVRNYFEKLPTAFAEFEKLASERLQPQHGI